MEQIFQRQLAMRNTTVDVSRTLYVQNLPLKITNVEILIIFQHYGAVRRIRVGTPVGNRGTAYVEYECIFDAKKALYHLQGFQLKSRHIHLSYYQQNRAHQHLTAVYRDPHSEPKEFKYIS